MEGTDITVHLERLKESFLWAAAKGGRLQEVASLLDLGADVDWVCRAAGQNRHGDTPLLAAVRNGHPDVAALLLAHGADPTSRSSEHGDTTLHLAASVGDEDMCTIFARNICPITNVNDRGETPLDVAIERGFSGLGELLKGLAPDYAAGEEFSSVVDSDGGSGSRGDQEDDLDVNVHESHGPSDSASNQQASSENNDFSDENSHLYYEGVSETDDDTSVNEFESTGNESISSERHQEHNSEVEDNENGLVRAEEDTNTDSAGMGQRSSSTSNSTNQGEQSLTTDSDVQSLSPRESQIDSDNSSVQQHLTREQEHLIYLLRELQAENNALKESEQTAKSALSKAEADLMVAQASCERLRQERDEARRQLKLPESGGELVSADTGTTSKSIRDLEMEEERLRESLSRVVARKEQAMKDLLTEEEDKRACVICQVESKTVLLMPCRHLCVCKECSRRPQLDRCPLCREFVHNKIDVYS